MELAPDDGDAAEPDDGGDPELRARVADARPDLDPIRRAVMRASAAGALFGARSPVRIGRYELVRELGTGGGGSVFVARDPELDREIAIKLIAAAGAERQARALAEGQVLARLSHPNIVPVFDVGIADDRVYLAMELVRGASLREHAERAPLREVVAAYRQAGDGLAAAHAAGLVHRDFKPDNAVVGADGRVRVVDFGLAGTDGSEAAGGTPRYMAPEQRAGAPATPAIDQYAFAVSLREAAVRVCGEPPPRWIEAITRRGSSHAPADRFPTLAALLRALANDPRTRWKRRALIATPLILASVGFAVGRGGDHAAVPRCDTDAAALAPAWTEARAVAAKDHVAGLGTAFAVRSGARVHDQLATYAHRWVDEHRAACVAARTEPSATVIDRRTACLASARNQLGAAIDVVLAVGDDRLPDALRALSELPDLARCADASSLISVIPPPPPAQAARVAELRAALDRVQVRTEAAVPDAADAAAAVVAEARALGYRPLLATALLARGHALDALGQRKAAAEPLGEAVDLAIPVGDDATAVEAYARLIRAAGDDAERTVLAGMRPILGLAARLGPRDRFAIGLLHNNAGVAQLAGGHADVSRAEWTAALPLARAVTGPGAIELAWVRTNLALVTELGPARDALLAEAVAVTRDRLGPDHPLTLRIELAAAFAVASIDGARTALRPPCRRLAELHPGQGAEILGCSYELGILDVVAGDVVAARTSFARVVAVPPGQGAEVSGDARAIAAAYVDLLDGKLARARAAFDNLAVELAPPATTPWYQLLRVVDVELGRAELARVARDVLRERRALDRAVIYLERARAVSDVLVVTRRLDAARAARAAITEQGGR